MLVAVAIDQNRDVPPPVDRVGPTVDHTPLAPIVRVSEPAGFPPGAAAVASDLARAIDEEPDDLTSLSFDEATQEIVLSAVDRGAAAGAIRKIRQESESTWPIRIEMVNRSAAELTAVLGEVQRAQADEEYGITTAFVYGPRAIVAVGVGDVSAAARSAIFQRFGPAVGVFERTDRTTLDATSEGPS